jgi:hypothetical protein
MFFKHLGITEVKPKLNRYKPALAEFSLTEVGSYNMFEKHIDREEDRGLILYNEFRHFIK